MQVFIYIAMGILILLAFIGIGTRFNGLIRLRKVEKDINSAIDVIKNDKNGTLRKKFSEKHNLKSEELFSHPSLQTQFNYYQAHYGEAQDSALERCDIEDYFNYDLIDQLGSRSYCEHIANALTALGILGTFIGLQQGMTTFDTSNAETVTSSISTLLGGMSTAFMTSIVGIVAAVLFGLYYRHLFSNAERATERFTEIFRRNIIVLRKDNQIPQIAGMVMEIVRTNRELLQSVEQANSEEMLKRTFEMQKESFQAAMKLLVRDMSAELSRNVMQGVGEQIEAMKQQMEQFTRSVEKQKETFKLVEESFERVSEQILAMEMTSSKSVKTMQSSFQEFHEFLTTIHNLNGEINSDFMLMKDSFQKNSELVTGHVRLAEQTVETMKSLSASTQELVRTVQETNENTRYQMTQLSRDAEQNAKYMQEINENYLESAQAFMQNGLEMIGGSVHDASKAFDQLEERRQLPFEEMKKILVRTESQLKEQNRLLKLFSANASELLDQKTLPADRKKGSLWRNLFGRKK